MYTSSMNWIVVNSKLGNSARKFYANLFQFGLQFAMLVVILMMMMKKSLPEARLLIPLPSQLRSSSFYSFIHQVSTKSLKFSSSITNSGARKFNKKFSLLTHFTRVSLKKKVFAQLVLHNFIRSSIYIYIIIVPFWCTHRHRDDETTGSVQLKSFRYNFFHCVTFPIIIHLRHHRMVDDDDDDDDESTLYVDLGGLDWIALFRTK